MDREGSQTLSTAIYACAAGTLDFSPDNPCLGPDRLVEQAAELLEVVEHHLLLVGDGGVGDAGLVEESVERPQFRHRPDVRRITEGQDIAGEVHEVGPVSMPKAVGGDDVVAIGGEASGEVRSDESGSAGDDYAHAGNPLV